MPCTMNEMMIIGMKAKAEINLPRRHMFGYKDDKIYIYWPSVPLQLYLPVEMRAKYAVYRIRIIMMHQRTSARTCHEPPTKPLKYLINHYYCHD